MEPATWAALDTPARLAYTARVAKRVDGRPVSPSTLERDGTVFAVVPGGEVLLGFDVDGWLPTEDQLASYARSVEYGTPENPVDYLEFQVSPPRTVALPPLLMAVESALEWGRGAVRRP